MANPLLYEINTRCWLKELGERSGSRITLATVPAEEFAGWKKMGVTHLWLMGVWTSGPFARGQALASADLRRACADALPGGTEADVTASPYAICDYHVPPQLGGEDGLKDFRRRLREQGIKLILDFVPNHLGVDHPWVRDRPDLFVSSGAQTPDTFSQPTSSGIRWIAHGKDPYFPSWTDTVQLDYRQPATREAMTQLLQTVATRCDGVRCDMAMLILNDVFARTWEQYPTSTPPPTSEFWVTAIQAVKQSWPDFLFLAEAYWSLEGRLQEQGFDYTYDKALYDSLMHRDGIGVQRLLLSYPASYLARSAHFLENHDEPRVASMLGYPEHRAAAVMILGLPGMRFLHDGQLQGARLKVPVQLARRSLEPVQPDIASLYQQVLGVLAGSAVGRGEGHLVRPREAWAGNPSWQTFAIVQWQARADEFDLVVVNYSAHSSQCYAPLNLPNVAAHQWHLKDLLGDAEYQRESEQLQMQGLYLDLPAYGAQIFHFTPVA